jgi:hypothetical protein
MKIKAKKAQNSRVQARCSATTKAGKSCRAPAVEGGLCFFHSHPEQARELGRQGGRKNRRFAAPPDDGSERSLQSVVDVTTLLGETINQVRGGRIDPRVANAVGYLATAMLKALQQGDTESRLQALEALLKPTV